MNATCILSLKLCIFCDIVKCVDLRKNMLFGETSLIKAGSLYAYFNAVLIQRINFLDICNPFLLVSLRPCLCLSACTVSSGAGEVHQEKLNSI